MGKCRGRSIEGRSVEKEEVSWLFSGSSASESEDEVLDEREAVLENFGSFIGVKAPP